MSGTEAIEAHRDVWAIVEIMGHSRFAGRVSEDASLGVPLLRVDVPAIGEAPAFTKMFGAGSIFGVTLCTEAAAREAAAQFRADFGWPSTATTPSSRRRRS